MKAIWIDQYGGPEVLRRGELPEPEPEPGAGEVLVAVAYAGVNFMDVHTRQGKYRDSRTYPIRLPITLGMEGAGTVVALGRGVGHFSAGDRVAWCLSWGSYASHAVVPVNRLARVPTEIGLDIAAAAMFQGCTAHYLIHDVGRIQAGDRCLVHAASGGIGQLLVQLAKRAGATVFATTSTPEKAKVAAELGADQVIPYANGAFADIVREATQGGVDVVFDAVGKTTLRDSFRATRRKGLVVNYGSVAGPLTDLDPIELGEAGSLFLTRPRLADYLSDAETTRRRAADIFAGIADGSIRMAVAEHISFDQVEQAHAALEQRMQIGKAVIDLRS